MHWSNLALKTVKGNLIHNWAFYDYKLRAQQLSERMIENEMETALEQGQFVVYLQPKHDIATGRIVGAEALARWEHPTQGLMPPARFIPLFERNGFVVRLDEYVWEQACGFLRSWLAKGRRAIPLSMNVSRIHAFNPGFFEKLVALAQKYHLPHNLIELELTESTFVENPEELYNTMTRLQESGFAFSMDDFGSGYSSLNMLKNVPVNTIKLDKEFLQESSATSKGQTVVRCTIAMARQLQLRVVAEGGRGPQSGRFSASVGLPCGPGLFFFKADAPR